jgi:DeoR family transcriptional regulator, aga operon transcriptional repressor
MPNLVSNYTDATESKETMGQPPSKAQLMELIRTDFSSLSKAFARIAALLIDTPGKFMTWSIQDIAAAARVSEPTVIRFCRSYGYKGVPDFRIAVAISLAEREVSPGRHFIEPMVGDKAFVNHDLKLAIARKARHLAEDDRSLILDSGSTIQLFAQQLRTASALTILTTGLNVVETLWGCNQHTLILPGGILRFEARSLTGRMVESTLQHMRFDSVYLGADSIDPVLGLSTFNEEEAHQNTAMMGVSRRTIVLVDSSKFRAPGLHRFCDIEQIDVIVTDSNVPDAVSSRLTEQGVTLLIADPNSSET